MVKKDLKDIECRNPFCISGDSKICLLFDRASQVNGCLNKKRFDKLMSYKELKEILESKGKFDNGEKLSYEEVFGHTQPGLAIKRGN